MRENHSGRRSCLSGRECIVLRLDVLLNALLSLFRSIISSIVPVTGDQMIRHIRALKSTEPISRSWSSTIAVALCFLAAAMEGFGLQSVGVAAGRMAAEFQLSAAALGWVASASTIGLLPGAIFGGELADWVGRKRVLVGAVLTFGVFTLVTTWIAGYWPLLLARFLTGLGMGAALPNLIALSAEVADDASRSRYIGIMYSGVPAGGALASVVSVVGGDHAGWRAIFQVGGASAILVAVLLVLTLEESSRFRNRAVSAVAREERIREGRTRSLRVLFGGNRASSTLLMWVCLFFHMLVIYVLLNWFPLLLVKRGFSPVQAGVIQIVFNLGAVAGNLVFGWLMDIASRRLTAIFMYSCVIVSLAAINYVVGAESMAVLSCAVGLFAVGGQMVVYAIVPIYYPTEMRGTGVGWAVAVGRLGAFAGPVLVGEVLRSGLGARAVLVGAAPALSVAAIAVLALFARPAASY